ncbi:pyridoxamine 5'-phosphate oxidase [Blattabacterium cuenoti]|uniref:pyridoxamine 5'-phosphate oxidase n=1 Tax=Blattabacterium cuenoti TaxID=1653831 RepID=UPI00163D3875|nr:pyridoxamine 5'-phosphate oxidase [Blattabacterium cuenoti]
MNIDLSDYRKNYKKDALLETKVPEEPLKLFHEWFKEEKKSCYNNDEINAMSISSIGEDGGPETRIVLLKEYSKNGFTFYTNYYSFKGRAIKNNPKVCISFYWRNTDRQVIVKGSASKIKKEKSDEYFYKRPKGHQIGSFISKQSSIIYSRKFLLDQYNEWNKFFNKNTIKRPFNWGGYIVKPYKIEFWQGQENRLHDRLVYIKKEKKWIIYRLSP